MKLNEKEKQLLRKEIEQLAYRSETRLHIRKEILEQLLFDETMVKIKDTNSAREIYQECAIGRSLPSVSNETGVPGKYLPIKFVVWSGPFLSHIDLSEVSFEDVMWDLSYNELLFENGEFSNFYERVRELDLSNTNAKIDFKKSFLGKHAYENVISGCNFEETNLSNNIITSNTIIENSNLQNTNCHFLFHLGNKKTSNIKIYRSNLDGTDFEGSIVDDTFFQEESIDGMEAWIDENSSLAHTGIHIFMSSVPGEVRELINMEQHVEDEMIKEENKKMLNEQITHTVEGMSSSIYEAYLTACKVCHMLEDGKLDGCYLNGSYVSSEKTKIMGKRGNW